MKGTSPSVSNRPLFVFARPDFPRQHRPSRGGSQPGPAASSGPVRSDPATDLEEWHRPTFWAVRVPNYRCVSQSYIFLTCFLPEESCCFWDFSFFLSFLFCCYTFGLSFKCDSREADAVQLFLVLLSDLGTPTSNVSLMSCHKKSSFEPSFLWIQPLFHREFSNWHLRISFTRESWPRQAVY